MNSGHMVHMANQIAQFFSAYPREEAVAGVAGHLKKFWERRMRQQMDEYVAAGGDGLNSLVIDAVRLLQSRQTS
jgi:formate dehydrogenase subunit delta